MYNILITTECVADLPIEVCNKKEIDIIYYDIKTEGGVFRDKAEIDSQNIMEYMADGKKKAYSVTPSANDFKSFFSRKLKEYNEIIHICISSGISEAYKNAMLAKVKMGQDGEKVFVVDSKNLSSGQGLLVLKAVQCREEGMNSREIVKALDEFIPCISTSFLAYNANYLYYNGKVKKSVMDICNIFHIHPVLEMRKGKLTVKNVYFGNYDKAAKRYLKNTLRDVKNIDSTVGFLTYAGCDEELLEKTRSRINERIKFEQQYEQQASATIASNCGPNAFGVLFARKE